MAVSVAVRLKKDLEGIFRNFICGHFLRVAFNKNCSTNKNSTTKRDLAEKNVSCGGIHLLIDLWGAIHLDDEALIEKTLRQGAKDAGATILFSDMHKFQPMGVSGVVVLAESHISIHTWPERHYAAIDIFMCGMCDPYQALPQLQRVFQPEDMQILEHKRGAVT